MVVCSIPNFFSRFQFAEDFNSHRAGEFEAEQTDPSAERSASEICPPEAAGLGVGVKLGRSFAQDDSGARFLS
jgi:hypothetical protein